MVSIGDEFSKKKFFVIFAIFRRFWAIFSDFRGQIFFFLGRFHFMNFYPIILKSFGGCSLHKTPGAQPQLGGFRAFNKKLCHFEKKK